jgi:predicted nucleic acid-binding protein
MGYKIAQSQNLYSIGTLTVLHVAKEKQLINSVKPLLDEMDAGIVNRFIRSFYNK